jgi:NAD(P)-dependent dehydrogenase (short-subunit alcohol dehydrogenase family)
MDMLVSTFGLNSKVAVVTGAARGIGQAIAEMLAGCGASVVVTDRDEQGSKAVADGINQRGGKAQAILIDVESEASIVDGMAQAAATFGTVDILVNNAAIIAMMPTMENRMDLWDRIQAVNVRGAFLCTREAAKIMKAKGAGGRVINISSIAGVHPSMEGAAAYAASKGGMNAMSRALAFDLAPDRITVNAVLPNAIRHPAGRDQFAEHDLPVPTGPAVDAKRYRMGRPGEPNDIASIVTFLAGPSTDFITGQQFLVDGGFSVA